MLFNDKNKLISLISSIIILFVPTLVITNTNGIRSITETTIFFPWLIFIRLVPKNPQFGTDKALVDKLVGGKRKNYESGLYVKEAYHDDEGHRHGCDCIII